MALLLATERRAAALLLDAALARPPAASLPAGPPRSSEAEDAQFLARKAAVAALSRARLSRVTSRLAALVPELQARLSAQEGGDGTAAGEIGMDEPPQSAAQMLAKLQFVGEAGDRELRRSCEDSEEDALDWTALLSIVYGTDGEGSGEKLELWERDAEAKKLDDELDALLARGENLELETVVSRHLLSVIKAQATTHPSQHSLNLLLRDFRSVLTTCYEPFGSVNGPRSPELSASWAIRATCALPLIATDVVQFAGLQAQVLLHKHPLLRQIEVKSAGGDLLPVVRRVVLDVYFDELQPTLHATFAAAFQREDTFVGDLAYWSRARPPSFFNVRHVLRLDGVDLPNDRDATEQRAEETNVSDEEDVINTFEREREEWRRERGPALAAYSSAFYWLNSMPTSCRAPSEKLLRLVRACDEVREAPLRYYRNHQNTDPGRAQAWPGPADLDISSADVRAILAFLLSGATNISAHAFSHLALLGCFLPALVVSGDGQQERNAVAALVSATTLLIEKSTANPT